MTPARQLRGVAFLLTIGALLTVVAISAWSFINPDSDRSYRLAAVDEFAPGSVATYISDGDSLAPFPRQSPSPSWGWSGTFRPPSGDLVHVVRLPDGQFRVLGGTSPHLRQTVLWFPDATVEVGEMRGLFGDDFSWWMVDGTRLFGPAPRDLPTYRFEIDDAGFLVIDLSEPVQGEWRTGREVRRSAAPAPYDVLDPAWPTSGWPSTR